MTTATKQRRVWPETGKTREGRQRLPHERDETPDAPDAAPRGVMRQAADDLARGMVDTDLHGERGVEQAVPQTAKPGQARPRPDAASGMRHAATGKPPQGRA